MMECDQLILLLHKYPANINKINNLSEKFLGPIIRWDAQNLRPAAGLTISSRDQFDDIRVVAMRQKYYHLLPKTFLSKSVTRAAGSWRIFFSSSASVKYRPFRALSVTYWSRSKLIRSAKGMVFILSSID